MNYILNYILFLTHFVQKLLPTVLHVFIQKDAMTDLLKVATFAEKKRIVEVFLQCSKNSYLSK